MAAAAAAAPVLDLAQERKLSRALYTDKDSSAWKNNWESVNKQKAGKFVNHHYEYHTVSGGQDAPLGPAFKEEPVYSEPKMSAWQQLKKRLGSKQNARPEPYYPSWKQQADNPPPALPYRPPVFPPKHP